MAGQMQAQGSTSGSTFAQKIVPATCATRGCHKASDGQPFMFGMALCWLCRLMLAGRGIR